MVSDLKALNVEVETEGLYDHGRSLPQWLPTAGAQLLPTDGPAAERRAEAKTRLFKRPSETEIAQVSSIRFIP